MTQQFDFRHLSAIDALAVDQHFGRAAARLHVARPAFSRTIQQLERRLGVDLVDRTTRSVHLTPAGVEFAHHARQLLAAADAAAHSAADVAVGRTNLVRIGFTGPTMIGTLPQLLRRLRRVDPDLRFDVREIATADQIRELETGDLDVGFFLQGSPVSDRLDTTAVILDRSMIGVPSDHPFATRETLRLADLGDETLILFPRNRNPSLYDEIVDLASNRGRRRVRIEEASSRQVAAGLVAAGFGVSTFTESMALMCGPDVALIPQVEPERFTTVLMGWHHTTANPFLDHLLVHKHDHQHE